MYISRSLYFSFACNLCVDHTTVHAGTQHHFGQLPFSYIRPKGVVRKSSLRVQLFTDLPPSCLIDFSECRKNAILDWLMLSLRHLITQSYSNMIHFPTTMGAFAPTKVMISMPLCLSTKHYCCCRFCRVYCAVMQFFCKLLPMLCKNLNLYYYYRVHISFVTPSHGLWCS